MRADTPPAERVLDEDRVDLRRRNRAPVGRVLCAAREVADYLAVLRGDEAKSPVSGEHLPVVLLQLVQQLCAYEVRIAGRVGAHQLLLEHGEGRDVRGRGGSDLS